MKKLLNLLLTSILTNNILFNLIACNPKIEEIKDNDELDNTGRPINPRRAKWYDFHQKIVQIIKNYFSIKNDVIAQLKMKQVHKLYFNNSNILYWNRNQKLSKYKELELEYNQLPNVNNNLYQDDINKIFTTMKFGIIYKFVTHSSVISFSDVFFHGDKWENNKLNITLNHLRLSEIFNIDWEYKTRKKNLDNNWEETYNENTQIKLFEIIQYYLTTKQVYEKEIEKYSGKGYKLNNIFYIFFDVSYKNHINMKKFRQWESENKIKPGYGVWKAIG